MHGAGFEPEGSSGMLSLPAPSVGFDGEHVEIGEVCTAVATA